MPDKSARVFEPLCQVRQRQVLRQLDSVAYIRFASVYRDFSEARDFEEFASNVRDVGGT